MVIDPLDFRVGKDKGEKAVWYLGLGAFTSVSVLAKQAAADAPSSLATNQRIQRAMQFLFLQGFTIANASSNSLTALCGTGEFIHSPYLRVFYNAWMAAGGHYFFKRAKKSVKDQPVISGILPKKHRSFYAQKLVHNQWLNAKKIGILCAAGDQL